jgi:hypothetical protein
MITSVLQGTFRPHTKPAYKITSPSVNPYLRFVLVSGDLMSEVVPGQEINSRQLWIQLLAGPVLWSVHFLVSYLIVEAACQAGWNFTLLGMSGLSFLVIVLTVLAVLGTVLFAFKSYRGWRNFHGDRRLQDQFREGGGWFEGPVDFMYFSGLLLSILFAIVILMVGLPALFLQPC